MFELSRFVFAPSVIDIAKTTIIPDNLLDAVDDIGATDAAETMGTPLNNLTARVYNDGGTFDDLVEYAGRQCYQSWTTGRSAEEYIENIVAEAHGSVFSHVSVTFQISGVSRTYSHEQVRHAIGTGISQESQRFVDADKMRFVVPPLLGERLRKKYFNDYEERWTDEQAVWSDPVFKIFANSTYNSWLAYKELQEAFRAELKENAADTAIDEEERIKRRRMIKKRANEAARCVLPNAAETRMIYSCNMRALRHILLQRGVEAADLEINRVIGQMFERCRDHAPLYFKDIEARYRDGIFVGLTAKYGRI